MTRTARLDTLAQHPALEGMDLEHTGGGMYALVLERPEGCYVVTDEGAELILGFYAGLAWQHGGEESRYVTVDGDTPTESVVDAIRAFIGV